MTEQDSNDPLEDLFKDIDKHLASEAVSPAFDAEKPRREDHDDHVAKFSREFVTNIYSIVYRSSDPREIAPMIKREFAGFKANTSTGLRNSEDSALAGIVNGLTLEDAARGAERLIKESERELASYSPTDSNYRYLEQEIRRLEIIEMACLEAKDLQ